MGAAVLIQRPRLLVPLACAPFGRSVLAWTGSESFVLDVATALLLPYLDGSTALDEVIVDTLAALDDEGSISRVDAINDDIGQLTRAGLIDDPSSTAPTGSDASGDEVSTILAVDRGERWVTTTERLPDGRTRRRSTMTLSTTSSSDSLASLLSSAGLTDVLEPGSCAAGKLRVGEPADDLLLERNGARTRIRVDDASVLEDLGPLLDGFAVRHARITVADETSSDLAARERAGVGICAYAVAPLDGVGPVRIYDRWGTRVGRPRDSNEAAHVLVRLLVTDLAAPLHDGVPVSSLVVRCSGGAVLVDSSFVELPRLHRRLRAVGAELLDGATSSLSGDGSLVLPADGQRLALLGAVTRQESTSDPRALAARDVLRNAQAVDLSSAQETVERVAAAIGPVEVVAIDDGDAESIAREVERLVGTGRPSQPR